MQLNRSPAVYVIVKNNSKDEEKKKITLGSRMENGQIILNTESTLCYVSMLLFIISSLSGGNLLCPNLVNIIFFHKSMLLVSPHVCLLFLHIINQSKVLKIA